MSKLFASSTSCAASLATSSISCWGCRLCHLYKIHKSAADQVKMCNLLVVASLAKATRGCGFACLLAWAARQSWAVLEPASSPCMCGMYNSTGTYCCLLIPSATMQLTGVDAGTTLAECAVGAPWGAAAVDWCTEEMAAQRHWTVMQLPHILQCFRAAYVC